jgi:predicted RNase H-like HicB family nuclease
MEYVYPAVFHKNDDKSFTITFPDLPGCISEGKTLGNAMYMAQSALTQWLDYLTCKKLEIPEASNVQNISVESGEFVNLICDKLA